jgi:hypothetical protein
MTRTSGDHFTKTFIRAGINDRNLLRFLATFCKKIWRFFKIKQRYDADFTKISVV